MKTLEFQLNGLLNLFKNGAEQMPENAEIYAMYGDGTVGGSVDITTTPATVDGSGNVVGNVITSIEDDPNGSIIFTTGFEGAMFSPEIVARTSSSVVDDSNFVELSINPLTSSPVMANSDFYFNSESADYVSAGASEINITQKLTLTGNSEKLYQYAEQGELPFDKKTVETEGSILAVRVPGGFDFETQFIDSSYTNVTVTPIFSSATGALAENSEIEYKVNEGVVEGVAFVLGDKNGSPVTNSDGDYIALHSVTTASETSASVSDYASGYPDTSSWTEGEVGGMTKSYAANVTGTDYDFYLYSDYTKDGLPSPLDTVLSLTSNSIKASDILVFEFNDSVNKTTFDISRIDKQTGNSVSIRYKDIPEEIPAQLTFTDWQDNNPAFSSGDWDFVDGGDPTGITYGEYAWGQTTKPNDTLFLAPPVGGWASGKEIRVEFDESIKDDGGNTLVNGIDQTIEARTSSNAEMTFNTPVDSPKYLPYVDGTEGDMTVNVGGVVNDENGIGRIASVVVKATSTAGTEIVATIPGSDTEVLNGTTVEGFNYNFTPNAMNGGNFNVDIKLPNTTGSQEYRWTITGTAENSTGGVSVATNSKVVYHETEDNQPSMEIINVGGNTVIGDSITFKAGEEGEKTIAFTLNGDYLDNTKIKIKNTYNSDIYESIPAGNVTINNSPGTTEQEENAVVTGVGAFTIGNDPAKDDGAYIVEIEATSKAGKVYVYTMDLIVDTIGLEVSGFRTQTI